MIHIEQRLFQPNDGWKTLTSQPLPAAPQLIIVFGLPERTKDVVHLAEIRSFYPEGTLVVGSAAGEIAGDEIFDDATVVTALYFERTGLKFVETEITAVGESYEAGKNLARQLPPEGLVHVLLLTEGLEINGSRFTDGFTEYLPSHVAVTGGLMGNGVIFSETYVGINGPGVQRKAVAIGLYSEYLRVGYASIGGWDTFGIERIVTRSEGNILYELDGQSALDLYKRYLGDLADGLPASGLFFPLSICQKNERNEEVQVVRTLLSITEDHGIRFAGDIPQGSRARLMKANFERLIDGSYQAAVGSISNFGEHTSEFALLVSCVGRKLVLKDRTDEEVEAARRVIGDQAVVTGFYSYGEICPISSSEHRSQFHNQTMTITVFHED